MDERMKKLREEVKKGSVSAAYRLAEAFKWGYYGEQDARRAARMYRICCRSKRKETASLGFYNLGVLYYHGYLSDTGESEEEKAYLCFLKSVLVHPTADALLRLGDMYRYGQSVPQDEARAQGLYLMASRTA